jgi:hypothetical protein
MGEVCCAGRQDCQLDLNTEVFIVRHFSGISTTARTVGSFWCLVVVRWREVNVIRA